MSGILDSRVPGKPEDPWERSRKSRTEPAAAGRTVDRMTE